MVEFSSSTEGTLTGFFATLSQFLNNFYYSEIIFCEGPGQLLGIRSALMFTRIAKIIHPHTRTYAYSNLALLDRIRNRLSLSTEGILCVRRNRTQHYIFEDGHIFSIDDAALRHRTTPIYRLVTQRHETPDPLFIPVTYDSRDHTDILRTVITPHDATEIIYDSQNEYKKWTPSRSANLPKNS